MATGSSSAARRAEPTGGIPPRFRRDLEIIAVGAGGGPGRFVRNPATGTLFEVGEKGAFICRQLDGEATALEVRRRYRERFGQPLSAEDLDVFVRQLGQGGLLEEVTPRRRRRNFAEILDPDVFLPLGQFTFWRGDRFVAFMARAFGWCYTRPFHVVAVAAMLWAAGITVQYFWPLCRSIYNAWDTECLLWTLAAASVIVQTPRALVHGMTSKRYGRQISGVGVALLYYILPTLYVGWSDVVWVRDRMKRFWAVFSGIYYQALLWAIATIGWHLTPSGSNVNYACIVLWLSAGAGLVLMNGNPLVAMDGYLLLSAYFEQPNLRPRALAAFGAWVLRQPPTEPMSRRAYRWMIFYGGLKFLYGMLHLAVLLGALWYQLTPRYRGAGALVVLLSTLYIGHKPIAAYLARYRVLRWLFAGASSRTLWATRALLLAAPVALAFVPITYHAGGPFQFLPAARATVRSDIEGVVEAVLVHEGEWVEAGQPLARIAPHAHEAELRKAEADLEEARSKLALYENGTRTELVARAEVDVVTAETRLTYSEAALKRLTDMHQQALISDDAYDAALAARDKNAGLAQEAKAQLASVKAGVRSDFIASLKAQVATQEAIVEGYRKEFERTLITAPIAGRVVTPRPEELTGVVLKPGVRDQVLDIEDARVLRAEVQVPEEDASHMRVGLPVTLVTWAFHDQPLTGHIVEIAPVAAQPTDPNPVEDPDPSTQQVAQVDSDDIAVRVVSEIPNPDGRLQSGMTGFAKIPVGRRALWDVMLRPIVRWFQVEVWSWFP